MELLWVMYRLCGGPIDKLSRMVISSSESAYGYFLAIWLILVPRYFWFQQDKGLASRASVGHMNTQTLKNRPSGYPNFLVK